MTFYFQKSRSHIFTKDILSVITLNRLLKEAQVTKMLI